MRQHGGGRAATPDRLAGGRLSRCCFWRRSSTARTALDAGRAGWNRRRAHVRGARLRSACCIQPRHRRQRHCQTPQEGGRGMRLYAVVPASTQPRELWHSASKLLVSRARIVVHPRNKHHQPRFMHRRRTTIHGRTLGGRLAGRPRHALQVRADQGRADQGRAGQGRAERSRVRGKECGHVPRRSRPRPRPEATQAREPGDGQSGAASLPSRAVCIQCACSV